MFGRVPLSIIRIFALYTQQWYMSYRFTDSLRAGWSCSQAVNKPVCIAVYTVENSWWWTEELSQICRVSFQNKFEKLLHLVGFIIRTENSTLRNINWRKKLCCTQPLIPVLQIHSCTTCYGLFTCNCLHLWSAILLLHMACVKCGLKVAYSEQAETCLFLYICDA
jgi:hypothetical protein